jgi:hypothetical protein
MKDYASYESGHRELKHSDGTQMKLTKWPVTPAYKTKWPEERESFGKPRGNNNRIICDQLNRAFRKRIEFFRVPQYLNGIRLPDCMSVPRSMELSERQKHALSYELDRDVVIRQSSEMPLATLTMEGRNEPNVTIPAPTVSLFRHALGCLGGRCDCLKRSEGKFARSPRYVVRENPAKVDDVEIVRARRDGSRLVKRVPLAPIESHLEDAVREVGHAMSSGGF